MARRSSGQRVTSANANRPRLLSVSEMEADLARGWNMHLELEARRTWNIYRDVQDGREWHPEGDNRPQVTTTGNRTWSVTRSPTATLRYRGFPLIRYPGWQVHKRSFIAREYYTNLPVGLQVPIGIRRVGLFPVLTCVRRAIRKSVLFATGRTRKGSAARRRKRSYSSHVGC